MNRSTRHLLLGGLSALAAAAAAAAGPAAQALDRISFATAWLCLVFFAAVMLIGPVHVLRTGRLLTNYLPRRDLGIWCALTGLVHLGIAFDVSMNAAYVQVYVDGAATWPPPALRRRLYFLAVAGSLVIAALFGLLLALSNNRAIRLLGPTWWKRLQRASYIAFALTVAHAAVFQLLEARAVALVAALVTLTLAVVAAQAQARGRVAAQRAKTGRD